MATMASVRLVTVGRSLGQARLLFSAIRTCSSANSKTRSKSEMTALKMENKVAKVMSDPTMASAEEFGSLVEQLPFKSENMFLAPSKFHNVDAMDDHDGDREYLEKIDDTSRPRPRDFQLQIEKHLMAGDLKMALRVYDDEMSKELVKPNTEIYRLMIHACGKAGYADKAFEIASKWRKRDKYYPKSESITDLFNSIANCSDPKMRHRALKHGQTLRQDLMANRKVELLNPVINQVMIKAFGKCGDLDTAFGIVDEMAAKKLEITAETMSHLLQACISDRKAGFRHAVIVYRRMLENNIKPNVFIFNLLLRAARDCGVGDDRVAGDLLLESLSSQQVRQLKDGKPRLQENNSHNNVSVGEGDVVLVDNVPGKEVNDSNSVPNLLEKSVNVSHLVGLGKISTIRDRFVLLGDLEGFLHVAVQVHGAEVNIKTFSQLLPCIENTRVAEENLIQRMDDLGVEADVDFFNQLINKRMLRHDFEGGQQLLDVICERGLKPTIQTYGCLASCTDSIGKIFSFLRDMRLQNIRPNVEIMTALLKQAAFCSGKPADILKLLKTMINLRVKPSDRTVVVLEHYYNDYRKNVLAYERGQPCRNRVRKELELNDGHNWREFCDFYQVWLERTEIEMASSNPWEQYQTRKDLDQIEKKALRREKLSSKNIKNSRKKVA